MGIIRSGLACRIVAYAIFCHWEHRVVAETDYRTVLVVETKSQGTSSSCMNMKLIFMDLPYTGLNPFIHRRSNRFECRVMGIVNVLQTGRPM